MSMNGHDSEIAFKDEEPEREESAPPTPITTCDMDVIIRGWEEKFMKITECLREVQLASERANSDMCLVSQEARAQGQEQERRLETMHEGLRDFLQKFETARPPNTPHVDALTASTPYGVPPRMRPEFGFQPSPVGQDEAMEPEHSTLPHIRSARTEDHGDSMETHMGSARSTLPHIRSARTGDHDDIRETRNTLPHTSSARTGEHIIFRDTRTRDQDDAFGDTRTRDQDDVRDTRTREHSDDRNARSRDLQYRLNERPTHEDDRRNSGDIQQNSYHSGNNSSLSRPSSSPKVPTFDGTNTAQFRPWIIQFEAIARHQGWTAGERVVRLVSSLTGPAANLLIGMTLGQLDNYNFLRTRLSRRYDPPEREEAHRAELRARTRRRNESADEFAENIKNLAQRAYPLADQNMLDNLVVERFREGHGNEELKKHLCLYPSTGLQDLIGACVRFETHVEIGSHARKSNEGLYTVQSGNRNELTLEEVTRAARKLGFGLRPWIVRQQNPRGFSNTAPGRNLNSGEQQQSPKFNQSGNGNARTQNPIRRQTPVGDVKCWTCGKTGHYASDCKSSGPKFAFAPKALKMNFLQQIADQVQEFSEEEQNPRSGND